MIKTFQTQEIANLPKRQRTTFVNHLSGFKSANLVGSISAEGQENLAIFSSAVHLGANPALIGLISRPFTADVVRHSLRNIRQQKYFSLNQVHQGIYEQAHHSSARYPDGVSEFEATGLHPQYIGDFPAPFVQEAQLKIGLRLEEEIPIIKNGTYLIVAAIEYVELPQAAFDEATGQIDLEKMQAVCISGLDSYHKTEQLQRLPYAKPKQ